MRLLRDGVAPCLVQPTRLPHLLPPLSPSSAPPPGCAAQPHWSQALELYYHVFHPAQWPALADEDDSDASLMETVAGRLRRYSQGLLEMDSEDHEDCSRALHELQEQREERWKRVYGSSDFRLHRQRPYSPVHD